MLDDYGALIRSGQAIIPDYAEQEARRQLTMLQKRRLDAEIAQQEREAEAERAFQADLEQVMTNPNAETYSRLILRHPKYAEKAKAAWGMLDSAKQQADLTQMGEIYSSAANGRYDLAAETLKRRIEADKAADGQVDPQDEAILAALESDDPVQQKAALGMIGLQLATVTGPDKFSATLGTLTKNDQGDFTLSPGSIRYDSEGNVIASAPFAPRAIEVSEGETVIEYQPGQSGTAAAPKRSMGWTPRARDGGDNSDRVVDNKIGVIAKRTGLDPDAPLTPDKLPALFDAIAHTEGMGAGFNNPGGIKDGEWAKSQPGYVGSEKGFAKFATQADGRRAGINLLGNFFNRGQRTVRDIIEGAPAGGISESGATGSKVIAQGAPKKVAPSETRSVNGQIFVKINGTWYRKKS